MLPTLDTWLACFERRAANPPSIPPGLEDPLSPAERRRVARSIATFQLGEQSEGRTLLALARRHAARHDCPALVRITECFIREEQRHAATLAAWMTGHDIPLRRRDWSDGIFRRLRRLIGFELAITVLITAELVGIQYYRALLRSTESKRLRAICSLFMQDEALHVAYESELLLALRARRGRTSQLIVTLAHGAFHVAAALVVWHGHRRVLRAAGHTMSSFLTGCAGHYRLYLDPAQEAKRGGRPSFVGLYRQALGSGSDPGAEPPRADCHAAVPRKEAP
jgi:rubrerythrin